MADPYTYDNAVDSSASYADLVTPGTTALARTTKGLWVGGAGNINVTMRGGGDVLFSGVPAGTLLPLRVSHVLATNTTATLIVALS